jgi:hypothetical protein
MRRFFEAVVKLLLDLTAPTHPRSLGYPKRRQSVGVGGGDEVAVDVWDRMGSILQKVV